jgi:hypothetical protein
MNAGGVEAAVVDFVRFLSVIAKRLLYPKGRAVNAKGVL